MTHGEEMKYLAEHKDRTKIWVGTSGRGWVLKRVVAWRPSATYIVDDEWAELRKAQADGKQLQYHLNGIEWRDSSITRTDYVIGNTKPKGWRIRPEYPEEPVYEWQWQFYWERVDRIVTTDAFFKSKSEASSYIAAGDIKGLTRFEPSKRIMK